MKMLLARVGWGSDYNSAQPVVGGGNETTGSERFNFHPLEGHHYGFFPVGNGQGQMSLKRIDLNCEKTDHVDGVLVVWVATKHKGHGQYVVGWYENATVFDSMLKRPNGPGHYRVRAKAANCILLPEDQRELKLRSGIIDGQSSHRYYPHSSNLPLEAEFERIRGYINSWKISDRRSNLEQLETLAEVAADAELEREQGFCSNALIRQAIEKHAEKCVVSYFREKGITLDFHPKPQWPWDFQHIRNGQPVFIEVKGTQGDGNTVILTAGEVLFARQNRGAIEIYVVRHIKVVEGETLNVSGGEIVTRVPWFPDEHELKPTQFRCRFND